MHINLYKNKDPNNKLVKDLELIVSIATATPYDDISIVSPTLILSNVSITLLAQCNYLYIEEFNRYYFIDSIDLSNNGLYTVSASIDVLMSYHNEIKDLKVIVSRQQNAYNEYIADGTFIADSRTFTEAINFSNGFNDDGEYILVTAGGIASLPT